MADKPLAVFGPFLGMRYSFDPVDDGQNAHYVYEALNMVPLDPIGGGPTSVGPGTTAL